MSSKEMHAQAKERDEKMKREEAWATRVREAEARLQAVNDQKPTPPTCEEPAKALAEERDAVQVSIDERTLEARAHERGMVCYSKIINQHGIAPGSRMVTEQLHSAAEAYRAAYDAAMWREP